MLKFGYADTPHGQVHYASAGAGEALILLPGSARSYRQFLPLIARWAQHWRVIAVDTLGYGASAPFPAGGSIETLAEGVVGVLDALGLERAHVFGMHTGHKVAAAMAAGWPQRVARVVIAGKTHSIIPENQARNDAIASRVAGRTHMRTVSAEPQLLSLADWGRLFKGIAGMWWTEALFDKSAAPPIEAVRDKIVDELTSLGDTGRIYHANYQFDFAAACMAIKAPALILEVTHESEDRAYGRQGDRLAAMMKQARVALLPSVDELGLGCNADPDAMAQCVTGFLKGD
ncbi:MAG: alpha/beta fold hydrolase [Burkholderiaceae bacterium]|nr:alpha/beta fold hydrolase [Burkholderiaceae bacterium]